MSRGYAIDVLPRGLASQSASDREVVLPYAQAVQAVRILTDAGWRMLGWEGWLLGPDGQRGHGDAPQGTVDFPELSDGQARDFFLDTMAEAAAEWTGSSVFPGYELRFCLSFAPPVRQ